MIQSTQEQQNKRGMVERHLTEMTIAESRYGNHQLLVKEDPLKQEDISSCIF